MAFQTYSVALDQATKLKDSSAVTTDGQGVVDSASAFADLGGGYAEFDVVIDWSARDVADGNELYDLRVEGSTTSAFSTTYVLGSIRLGHSSVTFNGVSTPPSGRMVIHCNNVALTSATDGNSSSAMRYVRVYHDVSGTSPSITYQAWLTAKQ